MIGKILYALVIAGFLLGWGMFLSVICWAMWTTVMEKEAKKAR